MIDELYEWLLLIAGSYTLGLVIWLLWLTLSPELLRDMRAQERLNPLQTLHGKALYWVFLPYVMGLLGVFWFLASVVDCFLNPLGK